MMGERTEKKPDNCDHTKNFFPTASRLNNFFAKYYLIWLAISNKSFTFVLANQAKH